MAIWIDRRESRFKVYRMKDGTLKPAEIPNERAGVLLPLPLPPYDYKLPHGVAARRGLVVSAPLGPRQSLGVVWGKAEGAVGDNRLKEAVPLEGQGDAAYLVVLLEDGYLVTGLGQKCPCRQSAQT